MGSIDKKTMNIQAKEILMRLDIDLDVTRILVHVQWPFNKWRQLRGRLRYRLQRS